jgi:RimJ/RimL family protein N-acetyltransferase
MGGGVTGGQARPTGSSGAGAVSLHPITADGVRRIEHWFDDPEVRHRLGPRFWIHRELRLIAERPGTTFRGMAVLRSYGWVVLDDAAVAVAFIGGDVYDRWVRDLGNGPSGPLLADEDRRRAMGLGYVVDPLRRGHGFGRAAIAAVMGSTDVQDVETFFCGVDADNEASKRCAVAAGFRLIDAQPDFEGMLYFRRERNTQPCS